MYAKSLAPIFFLCFLSSRFAYVLGSSNSTDAAASPAAILEAPTVFQQLYTGGGDDPSAVETVATGLRQTNRSLHSFGITEVRAYVTATAYRRLNINGNGANNNLRGSTLRSLRVLGNDIDSVKFFIEDRKYEQRFSPFYMCGDFTQRNSIGYPINTLPNKCSKDDLPSEGKYKVYIDVFSDGDFSGDFDTINFNINFNA